MNNATTHIDIRVQAKRLDSETMDGYEGLLEPFLKPPRTNISLNLEKHIEGEAVSCKVHIFGRCVLTDNLRSAAFDLAAHVPEARIELSRGTHHAAGHQVVKLLHGYPGTKPSRDDVEDVLAGEVFQVVLAGSAHTPNGEEAKPEPAVKKTDSVDRPDLRLVANA